jgi:hypothetical protein
MQLERLENQSFGHQITNGLIKRGEFMKKFVLILSLVAASCSVQNSAQMTNLSNENKGTIINSKATNASGNNSVNNVNQVANVVKDSYPKNFDCNSLKNYTLEIIENLNRQTDENVTPKDASILADGETIATLNLPNSGEVKNYSVEKVEKTKEGFKLLADWGGWNNHYNLQYYFRCENQNFYLYKMHIESIGNKDPGDPNNWKKKETKIEPNVSIDKFSIPDYLGN